MVSNLKGLLAEEVLLVVENWIVVVIMEFMAAKSVNAKLEKLVIVGILGSITIKVTVGTLDSV